MGCAAVALADTPRPQATAVPAVAEQAASSTPEPNAIFVAAMRAMRSAHALATPSYLAYKLDVDTHNLQIKSEEGKMGSGYVVTLDHANHHYAYQVWYRARDSKALSQDLATHEAVADALFEPAPVALDESPSPSPKATTTVGAPSATATPMPNADMTAAPGLVAPPSLGTLSVGASRYYRITFVGVEPVTGFPTYHIHLVALSDANQHPLTDLWVDTSTYLIRKASAAFSLHAVALGGGGEGSANFEQVDRSWMVTSFDGAAKGYALAWHANVAVSMRAHDIMPLASLPDGYFATPTATRSP
jgi:hypothetical protein